MKTRFNLASAPLENNRRFVAASSALGIIALAALALLSLHVVRARHANETMRTNIDRLQGQIRNSLHQQEVLRQEFKAPEAVEAMKRSEFLNGLIEERAFPWTKMFADLEQILPAGVRVISVSPQMDKSGRVKVTLAIGAVNEEQESKFLSAIDSSAAFSDVIVTRETRPKQMQTGNTDTVLLNLDAHYTSI